MSSQDVIPDELTTTYNEIKEFDLTKLKAIFTTIQRKLETLNQEKLDISGNVTLIKTKIQEIKNRFILLKTKIIEYDTSRKSDLINLKKIVADETSAESEINKIIKKLLDSDTNTAAFQEEVSQIIRELEEALEESYDRTNTKQLPPIDFLNKVQDERNKQQAEFVPTNKQIEDLNTLFNTPPDQFSVDGEFDSDTNRKILSFLIENITEKTNTDNMIKQFKTLLDNVDKKNLSKFNPVSSGTSSTDDMGMSELKQKLSEYITSLNRNGGAKTRRRKNKRRKSMKKYGGYQTETKKQKKRHSKRSRSSSKRSSQRSSSKRSSSDSVQTRK